MVVADLGLALTWVRYPFVRILVLIAWALEEEGVCPAADVARLYHRVDQAAIDSLADRVRSVLNRKIAHLRHSLLISALVHPILEGISSKSSQSANSQHCPTLVMLHP